MYCLDFAKRMLEDSGAFHPFAAKISPSGDVIAVGGWTGDEHPKAVELVKLITDALRAEAKENSIIGAAIAVDVNIPAEFSSPLPDGVRVQLESEGYARYIYVPYKIEAVRLLKRKRNVTLLEPFAVEIQPSIFAE
jgi:hypothetical protein